MDIKILDTTLRDGGYTNNWEFGEGNIYKIIDSLSNSGIDFIECGFISDKFLPDKNKTLYKKISDILCLNESLKLLVMANFGDLNIDNFIANYKSNYRNIELRISFKQNDLIKIESHLTKLKNNGIKFSLNPMHISMYSSHEFKQLVQLTNNLSPSALVGVDTMGVMDQNTTKLIFKNLDKLIDKNISFGLHAHDNKNLALANVHALIDLNIDRVIIIDSCLCGLSRGGGIVDTVELAKFLNNEYGKQYNIKKLETTSNSIISPIKSGLPEKAPYYLSAKYYCHPNYAKYLIELNLQYLEIDRALSVLPKKFRMNFNKNLAFIDGEWKICN